MLQKEDEVIYVEHEGEDLVGIIYLSSIMMPLTLLMKFSMSHIVDFISDP